ncbi:MAG TPA: hypothetical protein VG942_13700 [Hyphomonadaceae bacterium]|nr:hypothetical protein [Hyphomonadaceae bacterium]
MSDPAPAQPIAPVQLKVRPRTLALITGGGIIGGALIVLGAIMPAEFNTDPVGIGKLTGIARLWAPDEKKLDANAGASGPLAREYDVPPRTDVIEIPLTDFMGGAKGSELEYKVRMKQGATLIYEWEAIGAQNKSDIHFDFHGHTTPSAQSGEQMTVATYKQAYGLKASGALTAPFDGIQGWQFSNGGDKPVVIRVKLTGFYELVPPGEPGNEARIVANVPADQARPDFKPPSR